MWKIQVMFRRQFIPLSIYQSIYLFIYFPYLFSLWDALKTLLGSSINYKKWPNPCLCGAYFLARGEKRNNIHNKSVNYWQVNSRCYVVGEAGSFCATGPTVTEVLTWAGSETRHCWLPLFFLLLQEDWWKTFRWVIWKWGQACRCGERRRNRLTCLAPSHPHCFWLISLDRM